MTDLAALLLEEAYGPDSRSTADVAALMRPRMPRPGEAGLRSYLPEQPAWLSTIQHNPLVSKFLGEALPLALMGYPGRGGVRLPNQPRPGLREWATPTMAERPYEWPVEAAIRIGDQIFSGPSHLQAVTKAMDVLGEPVAHRLLSEGGGHVAVDGFLTNAGRYVSREEAGRMSDERNQSRFFTNRQGAPKRDFLSEALDIYDPTTGKEK